MSFFIYHKFMNTDYVVRIMMCGYSKIEAIILCDELIEDGIAEEVISAMEQEKKNVRVLQSESNRKKGG